MALLTGPVRRGPGIDEINEDFGGSPEEFMANYERALEVLEAAQEATQGSRQGASLVDLADERVGAEVAGHLREDWLRDWWPEAQPIEPILVRGMLEALRRAMRARLPMHAVWVASERSTFELAVVESRHQVTVLFLTPPTPEDPGASTPDADEGIAVISSDTDSGA